MPKRIDCVFILSVFFSLTIVKAVANDMDMLIGKDKVKIVAIPSKIKIDKTQTIRIQVYILNKSSERISLNLKGAGKAGENISHSIEGTYFSTKNDNLTILGYDDAAGGALEGSFSISIDGRSSYKIPGGFECKPFEIFEKNHIDTPDGTFAIYCIKLTIDSIVIKSNDFLLYLSK